MNCPPSSITGIALSSRWNDKTKLESSKLILLSFSLTGGLTDIEYNSHKDTTLNCISVIKIC